MGLNATLLSFILTVFLSLAAIGQEKEIQFNIYFNHDQYTLEPQQRQRLNSLLALPNKDLYDLHINGFTNDIGSTKYNLELSRKRAEYVKGLMRTYTIVSSIGQGELGGESSANRRVEIIFHPKSMHQALEGEIIEPPIIQHTNIDFTERFTMPIIGEKIALNGILFYPDQDVIKDQSKEVLEQLVSLLNLHRGLRFKIIGHICCGDPERPGMDVINTRTGKRDLSYARARSVYLYLLKKGIDRKRMRFMGMAYKFPKSMGDEFDRRVEIEITGVGPSSWSKPSEQAQIQTISDTTTKYKRP
jgi:outer membrane protein OmpA-like peptidoglycan-associated protein